MSDWINLRERWFKTPRGWTLMAYLRNGKPVCRYFYTEPTHVHD